jgi:type VI secretion system secreted protein Hcp
MRRLLAIGALALGLVVVGSGEAQARSFRTFMLIPDIPGSSVDEHHDGWIEVVSMSQGLSGVKKSVSCSDMSITKYLDQAGPLLWAAAATGRLFPVIKIEIVRDSGDVSAAVYEISINNARVTSSHTSGSSELPMESVSFSYQSITLQFNTSDPKGGTTDGEPRTITCQ